MVSGRDGGGWVGAALQASELREHDLLHSSTEATQRGGSGPACTRLPGTPGPAFLPASARQARWLHSRAQLPEDAQPDPTSGPSGNKDGAT